MTDSKTATELLPCPFCGGEACHYAPGPVEHHIECVDCYADIKKDSEFEAIEAWNTRAVRKCKLTPDGMMDGKMWLACSECHGYVSADYDPPNYCPHCGAKAVER